MTRWLHRLDSWLLAPAPPARLAILRVLIGSFVFVYLVANVGEAARLASQPSSSFSPVGVVSLLDKPLAASWVWTLYAGLLLSGLAFVAGLWFRLAGPAFAILTLVWASYHSSWGQMLHFEHLFTLHLLVLAFAPAAAVLSFDARRNPPGVQESNVTFGWPIRLMAIATVITYVLAGLAKLRVSGTGWIDGSTLRNHIAYSASRVELLGGIEPPLAELAIRWSWLLAPMSVLALLIEVAAPVALNGARLRNSWVLAALIFHLGTAATMMVWFPYQGLGFAMLPFFRVEQMLPGAQGIWLGNCHMGKRVGVLRR